MFFGFLHGGVVEFFDFSRELTTSFFGVTECRGSTLFRNFGKFTAIRYIKKLISPLLSPFSIGIFSFAFNLLILFCFISLQFSISGHIENKKTPRRFSVCNVSVPEKSEGNPCADGTH